MQPSPSLGAPVSSPSWSPWPLLWIVTPGGHSDAVSPGAGAGAGAGAGLGAGVDDAELVGVLVEAVDFDADFDASAVEVTLTPTPIRPFMPAAAWPDTVQRYSYRPFFLITTVIVADFPCFSTGVALPVLHAFAASFFAVVVQILNVW